MDTTFDYAAISTTALEIAIATQRARSAGYVHRRQAYTEAPLDRRKRQESCEATVPHRRGESGNMEWQSKFVAEHKLYGDHEHNEASNVDYSIRDDAVHTAVQEQEQDVGQRCVRRSGHQKLIKIPFFVLFNGGGITHPSRQVRGTRHKIGCSRLDRRIPTQKRERSYRSSGGAACSRPSQA